MNKILVVGAALALIAVSVPAGAATRYRTVPRAYQDYGVPPTAPFYRGGGYYGEPDPFIRGQIQRDIPLRDRSF
jgi:hypothetical protein